MYIPDMNTSANKIYFQRLQTNSITIATKSKVQVDLHISSVPSLSSVEQNKVIIVKRVRTGGTDFVVVG